MVAPVSYSPESPIPGVYDVQSSFHQLIKSGNALRSVRLTAAQERLNEVLREHTQLLLYMETHGRPSSESAEPEPSCFVSFHAVYDGARKSIQDSISGLTNPKQQHQHHEHSEGDVGHTVALLRCVEILVQALGWVLQPASPNHHTASTMSEFQQRLEDASARVRQGPSPSKEAGAASHSSEDVAVTQTAEWLHAAHTALSQLCHFATATYPYGAWFGSRNRRAAVRSRRLQHPSDIDEAPFKAIVLASHSLEDEDVTLLSEALQNVALAHTTCLAAVRATETRPSDVETLMGIFNPLNTAINALSSTCEDVVSRREDDRPHAHAVLEAGNIFTWLTTKQEPCVVAEEAFGSANTYLNKITARGNVLLLQQETGFAVDRPDLTKAMVTWASMLREVLQRVMLMVVYRYPRHVPWGELVESAMSRSQPRPPSEPRSAHLDGQPVWRRGASAASARASAPPAPSNTEAAQPSTQQPHPAPPPPPPPPSAPPATPASTMASSSRAVVKDASPSPSCVFDAVTNTWTVQHYHQPLVSASTGEEQEPVFVVLPEDKVQQSHVVRIHHCFNTYITVPTKVSSVAVEACQHTKLQLAGTSGPVRITDTEKQEMLIEESAPFVYATRVTGLVLHLAGSHDTAIVTKLTTDVNVNVMVEAADGEQEVRELALPAQFISTIGAGDALTTKEVTYS